MKLKTLTVGLAGLTLAGCATPTPVPPEMQRALTAPATAAECRMVYRKDSKAIHSGGSAAATAPGGLAGVLAVAVAEGIGRSVAERRITNELVACYDRVGAAPAERLPVRGPNAASEDADVASILEGAPQPVSATPIGDPSRRGPGGGAGFSTY